MYVRFMLMQCINNILYSSVNSKTFPDYVKKRHHFVCKMNINFCLMQVNVMLILKLLLTIIMFNTKKRPMVTLLHNIFPITLFHTRGAETAKIV